MKFKDKTVAVTGGGSGIGAGLCIRFAKEGAFVAVLDISFKKAQETVNLIESNGGKAKAYKCDVSCKTEIFKVADDIESSMGNIHVWINNAGISRVVPFLDCSEELWDKTIDINLKGTFLGCQAAIKHMIKRKKGIIINMSSQSGKAGNSSYQAYCASKFGIIGLTQSIAVEFASEGIRLNALCPGVVFTPLWDEQLDDYAKKRNLEPDQVEDYFKSKIPLGRLCTVDDIANAAVFMASEEASYITGQAINLSGGSIMY